MRSQTTLGIDITNSHISLALLSQTDTGMELLKTASAPVPAEAVSDGTIKNAQVLAKAVKDLCSQYKMPTNQAALSMPMKPTIIRVMELPKDLPGNPAQFVEDELKHYAVMSGKTIMHDFCALAPQKTTRAARLLVAVADEEKISGLIKAFNRVGINVKAVEPRVLACIRLMHTNRIAKTFSSNVLVAVMQDSAATLCVFSGTNLEFIRTVEIGEHELEDEAGIHSLMTEITAVKQFYDVEVSDSVKKWEVIVAVSGQNQNYVNLRQRLMNGLADTEVHISSPATLSQDAPLTSEALPKDISPASVGLAMKLFKTSPADLKINLLPAGACEIHNMHKFALTTVNAAVIILLLSLLAVPLLRAKLSGVNKAIAQYKQKQPGGAGATLLAKAAAMERESKSLKEKLQAVSSISDSVSSEKQWTKLLADIGSRTPKHVRITSLMAKDNTTMHLSGQALSYEQINNFVKLLSQSPYIASVTLVKSEIDPTARGLLCYEMNCLFSADKGAVNAD